AVTLRELRQHESARELGEDTLIRMRQLLGQNHPDTVCLIHNLSLSTAKPCDP
ncbi:MAG: tetratricopeptide repeat protein, partial [Pseudonocardiales bacterium]|nr:tetratricopeptide repeat protein [Pseudonocardiales bacterium]